MTVKDLQTDKRVLHCNFKYPTNTSLKKKWYITLICEKCEEQFTKVFQKSTWNFICPSCKRMKYSKSGFIAKAIETHSDKYIYDKVIYKNTHTKVIVTCFKHGDWTVRPSDFLAGSNCPKCSKLVQKELLSNSLEKWNNLIQIKNNNITVIKKLNTIYGILNCNLHGEYKANLRNATESNTGGCKVCFRIKHVKQSIRQNLLGTTAILYWVYLPMIDMFKLGCTSQSLISRFSNEEEYKIIWTKQLPYLKAIDEEHRIHTKFKNYLYKGSKKLLKDGTYECYHSNIFKTYEDTFNEYIQA